MGSYQETGEWPDADKIINLAADVDEKYNLYLAEIQAQEGETVNIDPGMLLDKFTFYHQQNPDIIDGRDFTGTTILSKEEMSLVEDWINGKEITDDEKQD